MFWKKYFQTLKKILIKSYRRKADVFLERNQMCSWSKSNLLSKEIKYSSRKKSNVLKVIEIFIKEIFSKAESLVYFFHGREGCYGKKFSWKKSSRFSWRKFIQQKPPEIFFWKLRCYLFLKGWKIVHSAFIVCSFHAHCSRARKCAYENQRSENLKRKLWSPQFLQKTNESKKK